MKDIFAGLGDSLDELLNAPASTSSKQPPASYTPPSFTERCSDCNGSGTFRSWNGRAVGPCFKCKGSGKLAFKTSPQQRLDNRAYEAKRKVTKAIEQGREREAQVESFKSANPDVYAWIQENAATFDFAKAMQDALLRYGSLTENQLAACVKCVARAAQSKVDAQQRAANAPVITADKIEQAFRTAREKGLKWPKLNLGDFTFKPAGSTSKSAGSIYVTQGGDYLGKITSGKFICVAACGDARQAAVLSVAADPAAAAVAYGKRTGVCSCCGRELTNQVSIDMGIGPICAAKYGW